MAKHKYNKYSQHQHVEESKYPSEFGSHASMVDDEYIDFNSIHDKYIICKDSHGPYVTKKEYLDTGFCDYNRAVDRDSRHLILEECLNGNFNNVR